jgi:hypothetical protein
MLLISKADRVLANDTHSVGPRSQKNSFSTRRPYSAQPFHDYQAIAQFDFMMGLGITFNSSSISSNTGAMMTADS